MEEEWRSWRLKYWWLTLLILIECGFIVTLIVLSVKSQREDGFARVSFTPLVTISRPSYNDLVASELRWTAVPAFGMTVFTICYATHVNAAAERQPYVELDKPPQDASNVKLTLLLDYPSCTMLYNWFVAFRNRHWLIGCGMLLNLLSAIALVTLTNNVFKTHSVLKSAEAALVSESRFDLALLSASSDIQGALDITSAIHTYGAGELPWMTTKYALEPIRIARKSSVGNISAELVSVHANLDCKQIPEQELHIGFDSFDPVVSVTYLNISFVDRNCSVNEKRWDVMAARQIYALSWEQLCSGPDDPKARVGLFYGRYSANSPTNIEDMIVVSCYPTYWQSNATVTIAAPSEGLEGQILDVKPKPNQRRLISPNFEPFQRRIPLYSIYDLYGYGKFDSFGKLVYSLARRSASEQQIDANVLIQSMQVSYSTLFASLSTTNLMRRREVQIPVVGTTTSNETRLRVVLPIAMVIVGLLTLMLLVTIGIFIHMRTTTSILTEEPVGLLGRAGVLYRSNVMDFVAEFAQEHSGVEGIVRTVKEKYSIHDSKCYLDRSTGNKAKGIRVEDLKFKFWKGFMHKDIPLSERRSSWNVD